MLNSRDKSCHFATRAAMKVFEALVAATLPITFILFGYELPVQRELQQALEKHETSREFVRKAHSRISEARDEYPHPLSTGP